jgi:hypothetical protein
MKTLTPIAWALLVANLGVAVPGYGQAQASCKSSDTQEAQILQMKKKMAEQDRRIQQLEEQVKALLSSNPEVAVAAPSHTHEGSAPSNAVAPPDAGMPATTASSTSKETKTQSTESNSEVSRGSTAKRRIPAALAPIHFGGNVYLYQYAPVGISGANPKFELYAFSALLDGQKGPWGLHMDYRFRTTKLRSFFPGNTWLQQGYVSYTTPWGEVKAGSFYRRVGIDWDDSFFGNIQYFDGFKLDPQFGVGFEGSHSLAGGLGAEYSLQYFSTDSRVNGSLPGRDFVSEPGARAKNDVTMRFAPVWHFSKQTSLTVGGSFAQGSIDRDAGPHNTRTQVAADATLQFGPLLTYGEVLRQNLNGVVILPPQDATYILTGVRWAKGRYQPRLNFSQGNYHGLNGRREYILQPGITVRIADNLSFIYEFDFWRSISQAQTAALDRSLNFVLLYHF